MINAARSILLANGFKFEEEASVPHYFKKMTSDISNLSVYITVYDNEICLMSETIEPQTLDATQDISFDGNDFNSFRAALKEANHWTENKLNPKKPFYTVSEILDKITDMERERPSSMGRLTMESDNFIVSMKDGRHFLARSRSGENGRWIEKEELYEIMKRAHETTMIVPFKRMVNATYGEQLKELTEATGSSTFATLLMNSTYGHKHTKDIDKN